MILLVGLYRDPSAERMREFITCIERNAANRAIAEVHVFLEGDMDPAGLATEFPQLASPRVRLIPVGRRQTYQDLFAYANRELAGRRVIVANADIFFDHTLARLDGYELTGWLLCLSRCDIHGDGTWSLFDFESSQDAWIFDAPIREFACGFHLGLLGCDNRLAWEAAAAGLAVSNPSRTIRAFHLHVTSIRRYTSEQRLYGPTRGVPPITLEASPLVLKAAEARASDLDTPCAAVTFHETMGYTVERLALGVSSHNNDERPFTAIPATLAQRQFTQVVSHAVSPVELEFVSAGRVYVLAGTDWYGYFAASSWLGEVARPEPVPLLETSHRPAFEAWSLVGGCGDRFVAPTQVMLVSDHLERRCTR